MANDILIGKVNGEDYIVGPNRKPLVIAEVGVLAFGDVARGRRFVDEAKNAGVNILKFQAFVAEHVVGSDDPYWQNRLKQRELPIEQFLEIMAYAEAQGILCFATTHNEYDMVQLVKMGMPLIKIGSGDSNNTRMIDMALETGKTVIVSLGLLGKEELKGILKRYRYASNQIIFLYCVTLYPAPPQSIDLTMIDEMKEEFPEFIIGYSDHTIGTAVPLAAVARGSAIIEKHLCLDSDRISPPLESMDITVALTPKEMKNFIEDVEKVYLATQSGDRADLKKNAPWAQKSIVARVKIKHGDIILPEQLESRRPFLPDKGHISIALFDTVAGRKAAEDIEPGTYIKEIHLQ